MLAPAVEAATRVEPGEQPDESLCKLLAAVLVVRARLGAGVPVMYAGVLNIALQLSPEKHEICSGGGVLAVITGFLQAAADEMGRPEVLNAL